MVTENNSLNGGGHRMRDRRSLAADRRDAALIRIGRVRRWMIAGAAALTAGLAALVSSVAPGRSLHAGSKSTTSATSVPRSGSSTPKMPAPASAGELGLQAPADAPQAVSPPPPPPAPPAQSSGGGGGAPVSGGS
jgi:hypothetical protein